MDIIDGKENLIRYMAQRPRAERLGEHGLFSGTDRPIELKEAMREVGDHEGYVWTTVVSLRREDAERLGYNNQRAWKDLICSQAKTMEESLKMPLGSLRWYASFHNEKHHPHAHIVAFCTDETREGFLSEAGINRIRSGFANEVFQHDLYHSFVQKTEFRNELTQYSRERMQTLADEINADDTPHPVLEKMLLDLANDLRESKGKKQYGWLPKLIKAKVDAIVKELSLDPRIEALYKGWCECQNEIIRTYKFDVDDPQPLEKQPEFRSIHNVVIKAALQLNTRQIDQNISAPTIVTDPSPDSDFFVSDKEELMGPPANQRFAGERRSNGVYELSRLCGSEQSGVCDDDYAEEEQECFQDEVLWPQPSETQNQTQGNTEALYPAQTSLNGTAAMSVARLLRSLGNNIYSSYSTGMNKLTIDHKQQQKIARKKLAQGLQLEKHEQEQY